jgi:hypothetical protein
VKKLSELCNQSPILEFEGFVIRPFDGWNLWMEHPSGEGTTIRRAEFLGFLIKLFEKNF